MTHHELLTLESEHPEIVAAILAVAKAGKGTLELQIDKTKMGMIARTLQMESEYTNEYLGWRYELNVTYLEVNINFYTKLYTQ